MAMDTNDTSGSGYFLYHSIGQYPGKAEEMARALSDYAGTWGRTDDGQWPWVLEQQGRFIELWGRLIGAEPGTLTTAANVTGALYSLIGGLPEGRLRGRRLLVAGDCFPSLHFLLNGLQDRFGFTLDTVPLRPGAAWVEDEDVIARWGDDVGLALLTHASSTSSHLCDLDALVRHGRAKGSVIGVDITQSAGLIPYDVGAPEVDFTVSSTLKWLCGTSGAGILHVARPLLEECAPELRGWFSQPDPFNWDLDAFQYAPDIRRFDNGTPSAVAFIGSIPALEWHAAQEPGALLAHNRLLTARLIEMADELGLPLATPRDPSSRGGSVMLRLPEQADPRETVARLRAASVFADARGRILRLSPGIVTDAAGVGRLRSALAAM